MTSVLKRLEEIERRYAPIPSEFGPMTDSTGFDVLWLLRLTRALLESQGELIFALRDDCLCHYYCGPDGAATQQCNACRKIARAERVRRGEV